MTLNNLAESIETAIRAANIPLSWLRNKDSTLDGLELFFEPSATAEQQAQARVIAESVIAEAEV